MKIQFYEEKPFSDDLIARLVKATYNKDFDFEYWKWRFKNQASHIAYIEDNGRLASFYAVTQTQFLHKANLYSCGLMNSAMTHPEYGGKGLFAKLEVALHSRLLDKKGFKFLFGFANHNAHRIHRKHAGWKDLFILNNFYVESAKLIAKRPNSFKYTFKVIRAKDYKLPKDNTYIVSHSEFQFARSVDFLAWRLNDPRNTYQIMEVSIGAKPEGLILFKEYGGSIDIMEVIYFSQSCNFDMLAEGLFELADKKNGLYIWSNLYSDEHVFLESLGFQERDFNTYFGYISNGFELDREKIHFRFLDSDVY
jgi:hypothetical protein